MLCQRRSRISSNTGGIRRCGSKRIRIPDPNKYKTKHTITKFCNLKIKWPKSVWNVENAIGLANSSKLFAPEDDPLNLPKRHWRSRLRIPEVSAILTIVGWRPLSFGWRPFMVCIPNATSKVTPMVIHMSQDQQPKPINLQQCRVTKKLLLIKMSDAQQTMRSSNTYNCLRRLRRHTVTEHGRAPRQSAGVWRFPSAGSVI